MINTKTKHYSDDFTNYYLIDGKLVGASVKDVPDEYFEDACTITDAVKYVQQLGCRGQSQHVIKSLYHKTVLAVLKMATEKYGETFKEIYRGKSGNLPIEKHLILFGATDRRVAKYYGEVEVFEDIRGLRTLSSAKSVLSDDLTQQDEEIIFFI